VSLIFLAKSSSDSFFASSETRLGILAAGLPVASAPWQAEHFVFVKGGSIVGSPRQIRNKNEQAYGNCHYQHHQLCGFHDFVSSPCEVLQPMKAAFALAIRASVAKLNTETILNELYVIKLSRSSLPEESFNAARNRCSDLDHPET